ncbi:MAG: RsmE family RNA methyltransferase [Spirochaetia bacterium]
MKQIILPDDWTEGQITFTDEQHHYLRRVRRISAGDILTALDRKGRRYEILCCETEDTKTKFQVVKNHKKSAGGIKISLIQCLPKGQKTDQIIRQAVELGIDEFVPAESENTVKKVEAPKIPSKLNRWERIIREAVQQSGKKGIPSLHKPVQLLYFLGSLTLDDECVGLFFHNEPIRNEGLHTLLEGSPKKVMVVIGPEGGFSEEEVNSMMNLGFHPVYLGENTLRTETAAIAAVSSIRLLLLERPLWRKR